MNEVQRIYEKSSAFLFLLNDLSLGSTMGNASPSQQLQLSGNRIGLLRDDGAALVKEGALNAAWVTEATGCIRWY